MSQECHQILAQWHSYEPPSSQERWRRTSGIHLISTPRQAAFVQQLWHERDHLAFKFDKEPNRILPDRTLTEWAATLGANHRLPDGSKVMNANSLNQSKTKRFLTNWVNRIAQVDSMSPKDYPAPFLQTEQIPHHKTWAKHYPRKFRRWTQTKAAVTGLADQLSIRPDLLITSKQMRSLIWEASEEIGQAQIEVCLGRIGLRPWQIDLLSPVIALAFRPSKASTD